MYHPFESPFVVLNLSISNDYGSIYDIITDCIIGGFGGQWVWIGLDLNVFAHILPLIYIDSSTGFDKCQDLFQKIIVQE